MTEGKFVAYYRVSTERQGRSGLGLEAQQKAVHEFLRGKGWPPVAEFTEVETGKGSNALARRPQLRAAIAACKKHKAVLVIAKLDRLARDVHFVTGLMKEKVEFIAVDNQHATKFTVHILLAVAELEAQQISERTKAALAAAKARGVRLGANGRVLAQRHQAKARERAKTLAATVRELRSQGLGIRGLADELNRRRVPTAAGGRWHVATVHRLVRRIEAG